MAAATMSAASTLEFKTPASFPIRLGASISKPSGAAAYASVRYNHKPATRHADDCTSLVEGADGVGESTLTLTEGGGDGGGAEYGYAGQYEGLGDSYVLVVRGDGKDKGFVLERLSGVHAFNLVRTPDGADAERLAEEYPQISLDGDEGDGLFGDDDNDDDADAEADADPSNPFDYRHFVKAAEETPARDAVSEAPKAASGPPAAQSRPPASAPVTRPAKRDATSIFQTQKKRKPPPAAAAAADKPHPKRVKTGGEDNDDEPPPPPARAPPKKAPAKPPPPQPAVPKARPDRKAAAAAAARRPSIPDDSGELILENEEAPVAEKPAPLRANAMSLALSGQLRQGPISLRSAASSPASRVASASPMPARPDDGDDGAEFEFGGSSSPEADRRGGRGASVGEEEVVVEEEEEEEDGGEDDEVHFDEVDSRLPSHARKPSMGAATAAGGDDDDDLDAQLALALGQDDDSAMVPDGPLEEDEESEEE